MYERAAVLGKRSIKAVSQQAAIRLAVSMVDLTTPMMSRLLPLPPQRFRDAETLLGGVPSSWSN